MIAVCMVSKLTHVRGVKKRKREIDEEIAEAEARKSNNFLMNEMAIISSRAVQLQNTLQEHVVCLEECSDRSDKAEELLAKEREAHLKQLNAHKKEMEELREVENRRALNA